MTKEQFGDELRKLIDASGLSLHLAVKIRDGETIYGKQMTAGEKPWPQMEVMPETKV